MKKVLGILIISSFCIILGLSVRWSREKNVSLVSCLSEKASTYITV